ncbi:MAG: hypothetical protein GY869_07455, partial [Planctomycetes bacterium]|nr:hypothetical protein [Planctomycetota bacterium]
DGDTTYRIGGVFYGPGISGGAVNINYPLSQLEFPLDVYMATLNTSLEFADRWEINFNAQKNINDPGGVMKDSDYLSLFQEVDADGNATGVIHTAWDLQFPDTYSESDASLDAMIFDLNMRYRFYGNLYAGIGYIYQNFDFDLSNVRQWNPISDYYARYDPAYYQPGVYGHGVGLAYEVTYHIPYLELAARG